ncbi:MAG TPA: hypothetical protein DHV29_09470 [Bacteroidales bacterium]|nr:MAG: hypothetical protein A2W94_07355 [Bacteroidetes bacterium GWE2_42_42]HCB62585.1 hypothetical protein [Bacteroidales bacterium]HCY23705.1 hypothetical protein [Bacteroidales bacterium]
MNQYCIFAFSIMKHLLSLFLLVLLTAIFGCRKTSINCKCECNDAEQLVFQTGFNGTEISERTTYTDGFAGNDTLALSDWSAFANNENIGEVYINYEDGGNSQRKATIEADPDDSSNPVLCFTINEPHIREGGHKKGRVNTLLTGNKCFRELYQTIRLKLHSDLAVLKQWDEKFDWLTLFECWNNSDLHHESKRFRISVGLIKPNAGAGGNVFFHVSATQWKTTRWDVVWEQTNENIPVSFGQWMNIEMYVKEGDDNNGRFFLALISDTGERQILFDVANFTHHPSEKCPDGFTDFNPQKLYTSDDLINYMKDNGKKLSVYWDDWKLYLNKRP